MTVTSLAQLREQVGLKPLKERKEKPIKCRLCGKEMSKIASNTWFCRNEIERKKDKESNPKICGNIYIKSDYK